MQDLVQQVIATLRGMWKFRWPGVVVAWVVAVIGVVVVWRIPDQYEAAARIYVDTDSILKPLMSGLTVQPNVEQQISMLSRTLLSRPNIEKLIRMADLDLKSASKGDQELLVEKLLKDMQIRTAGGVNLYSMAYTSGSMHGTPEQVAKTICFALTKTALKDKRKCFLISFSTKIETIELTDIQNSLDKLISFLGMSFNGGTDANPALEKSLEVLQSDNYRKADVLMVSDFIMDVLSNEIIAKIETAKENKTRFHSLTISDKANMNVIKQFNHNWVYNTKSDSQNEALVKQLNELK